MTDAMTDAVTDGFGAAHLPYGVWSRPGEPPRCGARIGDAVVDLAAALGEQVFAAPTLNAFLALGPWRWREVRTRLQDLVASGRLEPFLVPLADVRMRLPFAVGDYVDFYSSLDHATNAAQIFFRSTSPDVLAPNWRHLPVAYHGRAGTVVVSGTPVVRPCGQRKAPSDPVPTFGPTRGLDVECEVGFVVGVPTASGTAVPASAFAEHVFGVVLVNDWSARDIQMWESAPLGPFLGKSFATSIAAWVTPLDALTAARVPAPVQDPVPLPYLRAEERWALDLRLAIAINGTVVSRPPFARMYWTMPQQLAHATVNGAALRTGDLFATGTVSGPAREQRGSLLELSWNGRDHVVLDDASSRTYLEDGDVVTLTGTAPAVDGTVLRLAEVSGTIAPARC
jgi:fumarylacetoacetase